MIDKLNNVVVSPVEKIKAVSRTARITPEEVDKKKTAEVANKPPSHPTRIVENVYSSDGKYKSSSSQLVGVA